MDSTGVGYSYPHYYHPPSTGQLAHSANMYSNIWNAGLPGGSAFNPGPSSSSSSSPYDWRTNLSHNGPSTSGISGVDHSRFGLAHANYNGPVFSPHYGWDMNWRHSGPNANLHMVPPINNFGWASKEVSKVAKDTVKAKDYSSRSAVKRPASSMESHESRKDQKKQAQSSCDIALERTAMNSEQADIIAELQALDTMTQNSQSNVQRDVVAPGKLAPSENKNKEIIKSECRNIIVQKLQDELHKSADVKEMLHNLAKSIEVDMYNKSASKSDYLYLLSQQILAARMPSDDLMSEK